MLEKIKDLEALQQRLLTKCKPIGDCLVWQGATTAKEFGYGVLGIGARGTGLITAHRLAWILKNGEIPNAMIIRHKCGNKLCINTAHLELGSYSDNLNDAWRKGERKYGESRLQTKVVAWVRKNRGLVSKISGNGVRGIPDLYILAPNGKSIFMELKVPGGKLSANQINMHEELRKRFAVVVVVYAYEEALEILEDLWSQI